MNKIVDFRETWTKKNYKAFIHYDDGTFEKCDESKIESLWHPWVCSLNSERRDTKDFVVFGYKTPVSEDEIFNKYKKQKLLKKIY